MGQRSYTSFRLAHNHSLSDKFSKELFRADFQVDNAVVCFVAMCFNLQFQRAGPKDGEDLAL